MQNLKENERKLIKLVNYFRKTSEKLIKVGKLGPEHSKMGQACESLVSKLYTHAAQRDEILARRENLKSVIKDNAACPKCNKNSHLKFVSIDKSEQGWKMNKYKCRRCNIEFVWNRPNNPWDMLPYMEALMLEIEKKLNLEELDEESRQDAEILLGQVRESHTKLQPVVESCDEEYHALEKSEEEMDQMIKEFKSFLLIEKVKMDAMEE